MHVVATAGHVDHGKSTLVRALTGMEPDRWAEERRRGLTIDLGFAWTRLPGGEEIAFVDVPGHQRFVPNMLAGIGPVPAVLLAVAADEGWMPQTEEHVAALDALGVVHGVLAITRSDRADPTPARAQARDRLATTTLRGLPDVAVSATTGVGIHSLREELNRLAAQLPLPDRDAPVRLWVDRCFTIAGAGTVVTGTLPAGRVSTGDVLEVAGSGRSVKVRGLQSLGRRVEQADAVSRVALNLRGVSAADLRRGDALVTGGAWAITDTVDVRLRADAPRNGAASLVLHVGSAAVPAHLRFLGDDTARLRLARPVPLHVGDVALLRDPGGHRVVAGVTVLDVRPPPLDRRGAARARADDLAALVGPPDGAAELRRRGLARGSELRLMGAEPPGQPIIGDWYADSATWARLSSRLAAAVQAWTAERPLESGLPIDTARHQLDLPEPRLVTALARSTGLTVLDGRVCPAHAAPTLPPAVERAVAAVVADLEAAPFAAPEAHRLADLGLRAPELAAAVRAQRLIQVTDGIVLLPGAERTALERLAALPQPFTVSAARGALGCTRRVAVPLLELLDRQGATVRLPDGTRRVS